MVEAKNHAGYAVQILSPVNGVGWKTLMTLDTKAEAVRYLIKYQRIWNAEYRVYPVMKGE